LDQPASRSFLGSANVLGGSEKSKMSSSTWSLIVLAFQLAPDASTLCMASGKEESYDFLAEAMHAAYKCASTDKRPA
jgi:hypothetical protein